MTHLEDSDAVDEMEETKLEQEGTGMALTVPESCVWPLEGLTYLLTSLLTMVLITQGPPKGEVQRSSWLWRTEPM